MLNGLDPELLPLEPGQCLVLCNTLLFEVRSTSFPQVRIDNLYTRMQQQQLSMFEVTLMAFSGASVWFSNMTMQGDRGIHQALSPFKNAAIHISGTCLLSLVTHVWRLNLLSLHILWAWRSNYNHALSDSNTLSDTNLSNWHCTPSEWWLVGTDHCCIQSRGLARSHTASFQFTGLPLAMHAFQPTLLCTIPTTDLIKGIVPDPSPVDDLAPITSEIMCQTARLPS